VSDTTFVNPDLTTFCRLDELGLVVVGQHLEPDRAVLACRGSDDPDEDGDRWCDRCGAAGSVRYSVRAAWRTSRSGGGPRRCWSSCVATAATCGHVWRQDTSRAAGPRAKLSRAALRWALEAVVCQHLTVARVAEALAVSWSTANTAVLDEGRRVLIADPDRFDGVQVIGVDEHCWRHTRHGPKFVTVVIDLTPVRAGTGPARLLGMVEGRSKQVFKTWLAARPAAWRDGLEVVAMDGFTGFKTAATEELPDAVPVLDPFHAIRLARDALDECRRRVQQATCGRRGRSGGPLFATRRVLHLLTDRQARRLRDLFADEQHAEVEATWVSTSG
jgi:hypothetical protein